MTRPARPKAAPALTPAVLVEAPERAAVAMLRAVLDVTVHALLAVHPDLLDEDWPDPEEPPPPQSWIAHLILTHAHALRQELDRYDQVPSTLALRRPRPADLDTTT
jgi:hypothetical protein